MKLNIVVAFLCRDKHNMAVTRSKNGLHPEAGEVTSDKTKATNLSLDEKSLLIVVFISLVVDLLAFTVILPLLPSLLDYYGSKEVRCLNDESRY